MSGAQNSFPTSPVAGGGGPLTGTVVTATTRMVTPTIGTSAGTQHALPAGTAALVSADSTATLTNKTISGADNTLSNVPASALTGQAAVANGGTGLAALTTHYLVVGNGTSAATLVAPGTAGQVLTSGGASADPAMANPITATASTSTLGGTFTISADNAAYASTGLSVTLPSAGTYLVWYQARTNINASTTPGAYILLEMYNTTDAAAVSNSEAIGAYGTTISASYYGNATVQLVVTVAASKTIALYAKVVAPSSTSTRTVNSDANGRTSMGYVKLAP